MSTVSLPPVEAVLRDHVEAAAFLWTQHREALAADPADPDWTADLAERLDAHVDGLRIAGAAAWEIAAETFAEYPEEGELFAAGLVAALHDEGWRLDSLLAGAVAAGIAGHGLAGALARLAPAEAAGIVRDWLARSDDARRRWIGAATLRERGLDGRTWTAALLEDPDPRVRAEGCRLAELGQRSDLRPGIAPLLGDGDAEVRFRAACALARLGPDPAAAKELKAAATGHPERALTAMRALAAALPERDFRAWLKELHGEPATRPLAVRGAGLLGDPALLPWLVERMREPALAVAAGAAFLDIHGTVEDLDTLFHADGEEAEAATGLPFAEVEGDIPVIAEFEALLAERREAEKTAAGR